MTPLDKPIKRELLLGVDAYTVTISPEGIRIVPKGKRRGHELSWESIVSGDAALDSQLRRSLVAARESGEHTMNPTEE